MLRQSARCRWSACSLAQIALFYSVAEHPGYNARMPKRFDRNKQHTRSVDVRRAKGPARPRPASRPPTAAPETPPLEPHELPATPPAGSDYTPPPGTPTVHLRSASYGAFIYQKMVGRVGSTVRDGDLVAVLDKHGTFFGWGFFNSRSQIALRMFSHDPRPVGDEEISLRIRRAVQFRRDVLQLGKTTDALRLVHAEGDGLSGLVADRFGEYVVLELFSLAMFRRAEFIQDAFIKAGLSVREFIVRADKQAAEYEGFRTASIRQAKAQSTEISENGVRFCVDLAHGHKTGFFCDQRENRLAATALTPGRSVLDCCCYTGGFACYAATLGKARSVTGVDLDEKALEVAKANASLNQASISFTHADAFDYLRSVAQQGRQWDLVILDPSKFVPRREQLAEGLRKYHDLNKLAMAVVAEGGLLITCSCSGLVDAPTFAQTVARASRSAGRTLQVFRTSGAAADHPVMADAPQGAYLKVIWARVS